MTIKFKADTELEIVKSLNEANDTIAEQGTEVFKAGELFDAEILDDAEEKGDMFVTLQFPDGCVALGVQRDCFEVVTDEVVTEHVFSTSTGLCVKCGEVAEDNLVENNPCK